MKKLSLLALCLTAFLALNPPSAVAQVGQIGGGNAGGNTSNTSNAPTGQAGPTTEALGGTTTQGLDAGGEVGGGIAGGNLADFFVGSAATEGFVGGGVTTDRNTNRQFQSLFNADVPTGGNRNTSGTPRRVPTRLKVAFAYPANSTLQLGNAQNNTLKRVSSYKRELNNVDVVVDSKGLATLTGSVPDAAASRLAANLVRLQPGVRRLVNRLSTGERELMPVLPVR